MHAPSACAAPTPPPMKAPPTGPGAPKAAAAAGADAASGPKAAAPTGADAASVPKAAAPHQQVSDRLEALEQKMEHQQALMLTLAEKVDQILEHLTSLRSQSLSSRATSSTAGYWEDHWKDGCEWAADTIQCKEDDQTHWSANDDACQWGTWSGGNKVEHNDEEKKDEEKNKGWNWDAEKKDEDDEDLESINM